MGAACENCCRMWPRLTICLLECHEWNFAPAVGVRSCLSKRLPSEWYWFGS